MSRVELRNITYATHNFRCRAIRNSFVTPDTPLKSNVECVITGLGRDVNEVLVFLGCNATYIGS